MKETKSVMISYDPSACQFTSRHFTAKSLPKIVEALKAQEGLKKPLGAGPFESFSLYLQSCEEVEALDRE